MDMTKTMTPKCEECGASTDDDGECGTCVNCGIPCCCHGAAYDAVAHKYDTACDRWGSGTPVARLGVWTPWARIECVECDYRSATAECRAMNHDSARWKALCALDRTALVACPEGSARAWCNTCGCSCWVSVDVALCQQVGHAIDRLAPDLAGKWAMQQTGGMCSAMSIVLPEREIAVTAMDGGFYVGEYLRTDEPADEPIDWQDTSRSWDLEFATVNDEYVGLDGAVESAARMMIAFVRSAS